MRTFIKRIGAIFNLSFNRRSISRKLNNFLRFLITILFLILIYTVYRSEILYLGTKRDYYSIYITILLILIFFFNILLYLNKEIQKYVLINFAAIIFTLYIFELYLTFKEKLNFNHKKTTFEFYYDEKKKNSNIAMVIGPVNQLIKDKNLIKKDNNLYLSGISKAKTISCNENGYYSIYQSDRYGFNNPDKEWDSKEIEYLLVGDSFTHGDCVNRPDDISSVLRLHAKKNVLNLGFGGNGPLIEYATLREYLPLNVKNVLWLYFEGNDLSDLLFELESEILNKYLNNLNFSQNLKFKQNELDKFYYQILNAMSDIENDKRMQNNSILKFVKLVNVRSIFYTFLRLPPQIPKPSQTTIPAEFKLILKLANDLIKKNNGKLHFIYLPELNRYKVPNSFKKNNSKQLIKNIVTDLGIQFIDIDEEVFEKEKNPLKLFPSESYGHYNVDGYKKVALKIYEKTK